MEKIKFLFVFGTRPEAIKLISLIKLMSSEEKFLTKICVTGQHEQMLCQVLDFFEIKPDYNLKLMKSKQGLSNLTSDLIKAINIVIEKEFTPDYVIIQGDTTSGMVGALTAFYHQIKVIHVEAGLRSNNIKSPFPEEINRKIIADIADFHFCPSDKAFNNLIKEGINEKRIWNVGNTVIDSLKIGLNRLRNEKQYIYENKFRFIDKSKKLILVTAHRRENLGDPLKNICCALKRIVENSKNTEIVFPVHLNPKIREIVMKELHNNLKIHLIDPLSYPELIWFLNNCTLVITDSGGIQEEAPTLGKPVLVIRETTERVEYVESGNAKIVGTNSEKIVEQCLDLLNNEYSYQRMAKVNNFYGNGDSCEKIISILKSKLEI
ncbi:non-hydrolyzing UDP-N-acetylglucosamine 2-epimerase [Aquimarina algiphila]|uniref:non-hydrolyzing UDP-N-acetylglucosamine 2-epimerase n=1 Tax=Aquimarina algiphila TaxID=2047982 RepID=UPI00232BFC7C|nr:UDP-N-acetylglucosamine 2-epimerase (non-hydrolyzing) [Aquimarina algiphila]